MPVTNAAASSDASASELSAPIWWRERSVWTMLFLGFSAGIPILLIFGTLSLWLREAGVSRATATFFSWAVLGYSFKFLWAPLLDRLPVPVLTRLLGRRRSWMLCAQTLVMASIVAMALTDPQDGLFVMAVAAVCLGFASATQDVVIDAFRIESAPPRLQAMLSSTYIAGYRIGMIVAGAMALFLAEHFGSTKDVYSYAAWQQTYLIMASAMLIGVVTTLVSKEPKLSDQQAEHAYSVSDQLRFLATFLVSISALVAVLYVFPSAPERYGALSSFLFQSVSFGCALASALAVAVCLKRSGFVSSKMVFESYQAPVQDFFERYGRLAIWVLLLIGFYRISDIVLGVIAHVFYQDMGYSKIEIASISKAFGVLMTIAGSFIGGLVALRIGVMKALQLAAVLVVLTNLLFCWLASVGQTHTDVSVTLPLLGTLAFPLELALVITVDNLVQGLSLAAFIACLSALTNVSFTATQYAIFSSLMTLLPKVLGGYSGTLVDSFGYVQFFLFCCALGLPVIVLVHYLSGRLELDGAKSES